MKTNLVNQLFVLDLVICALERKRLQLHKKYLHLDKTVKEELRNLNVLFALVERNDATGVYIAEEHVLLAKYFNWTPVKDVRVTRTLQHKEILEYYVPKPIAEVEKLLEEEFE
jgi:hypothetical protein